MTISCIAIDDEPLALAMMSDYCQKTPKLNLIGSYTDAVEAVTIIQREKPDVLFLDIEMPDITGIQIVKNLDYKPLVVFTTAHSKYAVDGFELEAVDYLLKPFRFERFMQCVGKLEKRIEVENNTSQSQSETITIKSNYRNITLKVDEIVFIEALDNYVTIQCGDKKYSTHSTMSKILEELPSQQFVRIHRSYIINTQHIESYTKTSIKTASQSLPVGRAYAKGFIEQIKK